MSLYRGPAEPEDLDDDLEDIGPLPSDIERSANYVEGAASVPLMQRTWWKWTVAIFSFAILASFTLPVLLSLGSGNSDAPIQEVPPADTLAPDFTLPSASGENVRLYDLLSQNQTVVIVFYRGFF
jgi:hypothetical protein